MYNMHFPNYCGGRILVGFYTPDTYNMNDDEIMVHHMSFIEDHLAVEEESELGGWMSRRTGRTSIYASPNDPEKFGQMLYEYFSRDTSVGSLFAVTNQTQTRAASNLELYGFKECAYTSKFEGSNHPNCKSWVGDFHKDVAPLLRQFRTNRWTNARADATTTTRAFGR